MKIYKILDLYSIENQTMKKFANSLYNKAIYYSNRKQSQKILAFISFLESIIFPLPTDIFLIPMILARKNKFFFLVILTTFFSVLGGIFGYFIGLYLWDNIYPFFTKIYPGFDIYFDDFKGSFSDFGWLFIIIGGFTPFPYKIITISSGILELNIFLFIIFSLISRFMRFFLVGFIIFKYGESTKKVIDKYFNAITLITIILIICYFFLKDEI